MAKEFNLSSPILLTTQMLIDVPTGGVEAGEFIIRNNTRGFALADADPYDALDNVSIESNPKYTLIVRAPEVIAQKAAGAINEGQTLFFNVSTRKVTTASTGNQYVGRALESVGSAATEIRMTFIGDEADA